MKRIVFSFTILIITLRVSYAQTDSATLWSQITYLEDRVWADFPKTFSQALTLLTKTENTRCAACLGRAYMMVGKFYWANGEYPKGLDYFRKSIAVASKIKDYDTWSKAADLIANTYYYQAYYDSAEFYFQKAYGIAEEVNDIQGMIMILHNTSLMYHRKGDFKRTIEYLFREQKLKDELPHSEHAIEAMGAMETLMIDSMYYEEEIRSELENLAHFKEVGDTMNVYQTYHNLGKAYRQLKDYKTAARYFVEAAETMDQMDLVPEWDVAATDFRDANMKDSSLHYHYMAKLSINRATRPNAAYTLELLGDAHLHFNRPDSAVFYYDSALAMNYRMNNRITFTGIHRYLVRAHALLGNYAEAEYHLKTGLKLAKEVALIHEKNLINEGKFLYERMGNYKEALYYSEKYKEYLDSLNRQETAINLTRMQAEFKTAKKEAEVSKLTQLNLLNEEKIKTRNLQGILAIVSLVLIGSFGGLYYSRFRQKKKVSEQLQRQNMIIEHQYGVVRQQNEEKEALLHEIHHRVKNNLQIISSLINLKSRNAENDTQGILKDLNSRIHSLGLIHEMLYKSDNLGFVNLKEYLMEQCQLTVNSFETERIELCMDIEHIEANMDSALAIGLISNELITNAIKYAFSTAQEARKIYVSLHRKLEEWVFKIGDNGENLSEKDELMPKSFGLRFVEQLVRTKLNGEMRIEIRNGLHIEMKINPENITYASA